MSLRSMRLDVARPLPGSDEPMYELLLHFEGGGAMERFARGESVESVANRLRRMAANLERESDSDLWASTERTGRPLQHTHVWDFHPYSDAYQCRVCGAQRSAMDYMTKP